jgi:hypothetical protein
MKQSNPAHVPPVEAQTAIHLLEHALKEMRLCVETGHEEHAINAEWLARGATNMAEFIGQAIRDASALRSTPQPGVSAATNEAQGEALEKAKRRFFAVL